MLAGLLLYILDIRLFIVLKLLFFKKQKFVLKNIIIFFFTGSSLSTLSTPPSGLNGLPASSSLGMPFDPASTNVNSVSIPVTPSDVHASISVAPTSTKQKKK